MTTVIARAGLARGSAAVARVSVPAARLAFAASGLFVVLLVVSAAGMVLAAVFVPDRVNRLHEVGAMLDNVPFAADSPVRACSSADPTGS